MLCTFLLLYSLSRTMARYNSVLKMLGPYLDTLIIAHTSCNMLTILNELTMHRIAYCRDE